MSTITTSVTIDKPFALYPSDLRCEIGRRSYSKTNPYVDGYINSINSKLRELSEADPDLLLSKLDNGEIINLEIPLIPMDDQISDEVLKTVAINYSNNYWGFSWAVRVKTTTAPDGSISSTPYLSVKLSAQE